MGGKRCKESMGKKRGKKKKAAAPAADDDDDALLEAAILANTQRAKQEREEELQSKLKEAEQQLEEGMLNRNDFNAVKQMATKTIIPGQPVPSFIKEALQKALEEIEREDALLEGDAPDEDDGEKPFEHKPPSASTDERALRRQKRMIERMRWKRKENVARRNLSAEDLEHCKRYNMTEKQLRAVRRVGLQLPHESRAATEAKHIEACMAKEDDLFGLGEEPSLEDMFSALRSDDKFMSTPIQPCPDLKT